MPTHARRRRARPSHRVEPLEPRRLLTAGDLDTTFGNAGVTVTDLDKYSESVADAALGQNGAIYVAVRRSARALLLRYTADGLLDTTFGTLGTGFVQQPAADTGLEPSAIAVQPDGKILVGGTIFPGNTAQFSMPRVYRFNPDGSLDTTFGKNAAGYADFGSTGSALADLAVQGDGKILATGDDHDRFFVDRLTTTGAYDTTFNNGLGFQSFTFPGYTTFEGFKSVALAPDGRIVCAGTAFNSGSSLVIVRLLANGSPDPAFDADGRVFTSIPGAVYSDANTVAVQDDGKIVVGGHTSPAGGGNSRAFAARFTTTGVFDSTFGTAGVVRPDANPAWKSQDVADVVPFAQGQILLGGGYAGAASTGFPVEVLRANGTPDPAFGNLGFTSTTVGSAPRAPVTTLLVQRSGRIVAVGTTSDNADLVDTALARYEGFFVELPDPDTGGPYTVPEGGSITLAGSALVPQGRTIAAYEWDFDYDGSSFDVDATGPNPTFSAGNLDGPTQRIIGLRVRDNTGAQSFANKVIVTVTNRAPTATFAFPDPTPAGQFVLGYLFDATDFAAPDVAAGFKYSFDLDGDGIFEVVNSTSSSSPVTFNTAGLRIIHARVTDKDGGSTDYSRTVTVTPPLPITTGTVSGVVFNDLDLDGVRDANEGAPAPRSLFLDKNDNGLADPDEPATVSSAANGSFTFFNVPAGVYVLTQNGTYNAYQTTPKTRAAATLTLVAGGAVQLNVGISRGGSIVDGHVFTDANANGRYDVGEPLVGGRTIYADLNNNNALDAGEPSDVSEQFPASLPMWNYELRLPGAGTYVIRQILPAGWVQTIPAGAGGFPVDVAANQIFGSVDFSSKQQTTPPPPPGYKGTPFSGTPITIAATGTTTLQAENFDNGGEAVAFHDADSANVGGLTSYRPTAVDLGPTTDGAANGVMLNYTRAGEWLKYSLDVAKAANYNVGFRVASLKAGGTLHLEIDGAKVGASITVPDTAAWTTWKTITLANVPLPAGKHVLTLKFDAVGALGYVANLNYLTFTPSTVTPPPPPPAYAGTPFKGTAAKVNATGSSTVEAENFDEGGQGVGYNDTDAANVGTNTTYRATGVDLVTINDGGAGVGVGYAKAGEWLKYTLDVAADGAYDLETRLASLTGGGAFHFEVDGVRLAPNVTVPKTGAWTTYATVKQSNVTLKAGKHVVRLVMDTNGGAGFVANFNWFRFTRK